VPRGQDKRQSGQDHAIYATDYGQWISPADAAQAQLEAIRFRATDLTEIVRIPAKGKCRAGHNHANSWNQ